MSAPRKRIAMLLQRTVEHDSRVRREAVALAGAGHEVILLEHAPTGPDLPGVRRLEVLRAPAWRRLPRRGREAALTVAFVAAAARERPEAIHAHDVAMLVPALVAARLARADLVYDTHELATGVLYRGAVLRRLAAAIERVAVPSCSAVITPSEAIAQRLADRHRRSPDTVVLRNVCDLPRPSRAEPPAGLRARLGLGDDTPLLLFQGAAAPGRGCEPPIRALAVLPGVHLAFLGDAEPGFGARLSELARREGVADRVHFVPSVPLDRLLAHTREADVGLAVFDGTSESHRLTLPNKLFELFAAGVPVLAAAGTETGRLVERFGAGWTVDARDQQAVTAALRRALDQCREPSLLARVQRADAEAAWVRERDRLLGVYAEPRTALLVVRNPFTHDARVLRAGRLLRDMGFRTGVIALRTRTDQPRAEHVDGLPVVRIGHDLPGAARLRGEPPPTTPVGRRRPSPALRAYRSLRALNFTRRALGVVLRERPALVHCNDFNTMWVGVLAKALVGSAVVYDSHELWADRNGRWEWRPALVAQEAVFMRLADRVVTVSPEISRELAARYRAAAPEVVRNVPVARPNGSGATTRERRAVFVGQLRHGWSLERAIDALALVPDLRLRIIGPDAHGLGDGLRMRARSAGVADRVELPGSVGPDDVVAALEGASIGLNLIEPTCRSHELTLPNKLHEYVIARVPVLTSDVPASAAYVRERGVGDVVASLEVEAIALGMRRLLDEERAAAIRGRLDAEARELSWDRERERLQAVYASALR